MEMRWVFNESNDESICVPCYSRWYDRFVLASRRLRDHHTGCKAL